MSQDQEQKAMREKYWEERSTEEQVEVLRSELRTAIIRIRNLHGEIDMLQKHSHNGEGEIVVPLRSVEASSSRGKVHSLEIKR